MTGVLSWALLAGVSCTQQIPCSDTQTCAPEDSPDASADAGDSGALDATFAQDGASANCDSNHQDCDLASFNGCETDIRTNRNHCGKCGAFCDGTCDDKICTR